MYPIYSAAVRNAITLEKDPALVGQQIQVVSRGTTTPYPIYDAASDPIPSSLVTVTSTGDTPTVYIETETPASVYLDWYHAGSGERGPIVFEEQLRDQAESASASSSVSAAAATSALAAAEALDSVRMVLAGPAVAAGGTFWGVWNTGDAPVPPNDGRVHWGFEIV